MCNKIELNWVYFVSAFNKNYIEQSVTDMILRNKQINYLNEYVFLLEWMHLQVQIRSTGVINL